MEVDSHQVQVQVARLALLEPSGALAYSRTPSVVGGGATEAFYPHPLEPVRKKSRGEADAAPGSIVSAGNYQGGMQTAPAAAAAGHAAGIGMRSVTAQAHTAAATAAKEDKVDLLKNEIRARMPGFSLER